MAESVKKGLSSLALSRLSLLESIFRSRSLSSAAKEAGLSVSSASRQLAQARADFGDELFIRSGYEMIPTDRMRDLAAELAPLLAKLRSLTETDVFEPAALTHTFRIMTADNGFMAFLAPVIREFTRQAPRASLEILTISEAEIAPKLRDGRADLAIFPTVPPDADIAGLPLARLTYSILMRRDHPLALELRQHGLDALTKDMIRRWPQAFTSLQAKLFLDTLDAPSTLRIPYFNTAPFVLLDTDYVAWLPSSAAEYWEHFPGLACFPVPERFTVGFVPSLIWSRRSSGSPENVWLRSLIISSARERLGAVAAECGKPREDIPAA